MKTMRRAMGSLALILLATATATACAGPKPVPAKAVPPPPPPQTPLVLHLEPGASFTLKTPIALEAAVFNGDDPASAPIESALSDRLAAAMKAAQITPGKSGEAELTINPVLISYVGPPLTAKAAAGAPFIRLGIPGKAPDAPKATQSCVLWLTLVDRKGTLVGEQVISSEGEANVLDVCAADAARLIASNAAATATPKPPDTMPPEPSFSRKPTIRVAPPTGFTAGGILLSDKDLSQQLSDALFRTGTFGQVSTSPTAKTDYEVTAELVGERYFSADYTLVAGDKLAARHWSVVLIRYRVRSVSTKRQLFAETVLTQAEAAQAAESSNILSIAKRLGNALAPKS